MIYTEKQVLNIIASIYSTSNIMEYQNLMSNLLSENKPEFSTQKYIQGLLKKDDIMDAIFPPKSEGDEIERIKDMLSLLSMNNTNSALELSLSLKKSTDSRFNDAILEGIENIQKQNAEIDELIKFIG